MYPAPIEEYLRPCTITEALAAAKQYAGEATFIAGGQSVMQAIKSRMVRPRCVIDLQAIAELKGIKRGNGEFTIGAYTRYVEIAEDASIPVGLAALRDAAQHVGDRQVRNRGTIGGSCCWNYVASCMPAVTLALDGAMQLQASSGVSRTIAIDDFLIAPLETARADDELLLSIAFKDSPRSGSAYKKWGLVTDALPVVGVCVNIALDGAGKCSAARVSLSGLAAGAQRAPIGESALIGSAGDPGSIDKAFAAIANTVDAQSDQWADADYRRQLIKTLGREVATTAFARARG